MNQIRLGIAGILIVWLSLDVAVAQLRIQLQVSKPYPSKITDFQSYPNQIVILINNTSNAAYRVQLLGSVSGDNNVSVRTSANFRSARAIDVAPLSVTRVSAEDVSELFDPNSLVFAGLSREQAIRMNGLPEGLYQVCVRAVDYTSRAPLSDEEPLGCSNLFTVSNLEPPVIIKPFNDEEIKAGVPQNLIFSWSMPPGASPTTQYIVRIVEMIDPKRNPFDVMRSSRQLFYETTLIGAPTMLYGPAEPPMVPGRRYAMMVTATDPFGNLVFRNGGRSEVIAFTYGQPSQERIFRDNRIGDRGRRDNIPRVVLTGRIKWSFRATEKKQGLSAFVVADAVSITGIENSVVAEAMIDPSAGPAMNAVVTSALNGIQVTSAMINTAVVSAASKPDVSVVQSPRSVASASQSPGVVVSGAGRLTGVTSPTLSAAAAASDRVIIPGLLGNDNYPLQKIPVKIYVVNRNGSQSLLTTAITDDEGNFSASFVSTAFYNPALGDKLKVTIDHPDFLLERTFTSLPPADSTGRKDLGTLTAGARSFRFRPTVIDDEGKPVNDAVVEIYRALLYHNQNRNHRNEGNGSPSEEFLVNSIPCVKVGEVRSGQTIGRLFYSDDWMDQYHIRVVNSRINPLTTTLKAMAEGSAKEEVLTICKEYKTSLRMPTLKGTVSKKLEPILPASGAIVTLHINRDADYGPPSSQSLERIGNQFLNGATSNITVNTTNQIQGQAAVNTATSVSATPNPPAREVGNSNIFAAMHTSASTSASFVGSMPTSVSAAKILGETRSATADSAGHYIFSNLPVSAKITKISIRLPGSSEVFYDSVMIDQKGVDIEKDIMLSMTVFTLGGVIKNEESQPIPYPVMRWASGGSTFEGDAEGRFVATNTSGNDTLIVTKLGFEVRRVPVSLKAPPKGDPKKNGIGASVLASPQQWGTSVAKLSSLKVDSPESPPFTAKGLGLHPQPNITLNPIPAGNTAASGAKPAGNVKGSSGPVMISHNVSPIMQNSFELGALYNSLVKPDQQPIPPVDLGTITLRRRIGRLLVKVLSVNDSSVISNARVRIIDTPKTGETNAQGLFYTEVPGGEIIVQVDGPQGSAWIPVQKQIPTSDTDTTLLRVVLKTGVRISGVVRARNQTASSARVRVDGFEYINTESDSEGKYELIVPQGDYTIKATKPGFIGGQKQQVFSGTHATLDLELGQAGFDISKILGFEVEIESMSGSGNTRTLSGAFVNMPSNPVFNIKSDLRIPFNNLVVDLINSIPVPKGGTVKLSITTIEAKAYDYLPVTIRNNDLALVIKQHPDNNRTGTLNGIAEINYGKFTPIPLGYVFPSNVRHTLSTTGGSAEMVILQSGESIPSVEALMLKASANATAEVYGFSVTLDLPSSRVTKDGISMKGELSLAGVPLMKDGKLKIKELLIDKNGGISRAEVDVPVDQSLSLGGWGMALQSIRMNENGMKLSGNIRITIPSSAQSEIGFSNLSLSKTAMYGGEFSLPDQGIDIFNIVKMKRGQRPLSFGRLGNTAVYYVGGSGRFNLPKLIDKTLEVNFFQIQTDGKFAASVPANFNASLFGLANLTIHNIGFRTTGGVGIDVKGDFNLNAIPFFKATAGGIHYESNGSVSVEELGLGFDLVGVAKLNARVRFIDTPQRKGFEGEGSIGINATPLQLGMGFKYYKLSAGIEVGAKLKAGLMIPLGAVTLTEVEGEFELNTQAKSWMARMSASASVGGANALIALKPLAITVRNGPVFEIDAGLAVLNQRIAKARGLLDFPKSYFSLTFEQKVDFLPKLFTSNSSGAFIISTAANDTYWMVGVHTSATMLGGLVKGNANITAGWGLKIHAHPELSNFTNYIDPAYLDNGTLKGIHVATFAGINFDSGHRGFAGVATGRIYYKNFSAVNIDMGFGRGRYGFRVAAGWEAGGEIRIMDRSIAGLVVGMTGEVKGFYDYSTSYINLEGSLQAKLEAWFGACENGCATKVCWGACFNACLVGCEVCPIPVGGKICLHPGVHAGYNSETGFRLSLDL